MTTTHAALSRWVDQVAGLTCPDRIHWCDGSPGEYDALLAQMLASGELHPLEGRSHPNCYLHRSHPDDVARVEHLTYICTSQREDAGPNNLWMDPTEAHRRMDALYAGCMRGRTLYVIPYCMGPIESPLARCGVEITDSAYVVANMRIMTRMGSAALRRIEREGTFIRGLHSTGELDPERRFIMHFPEELSIQSYGSGYGGNALLGKKCHALRIASWQARNEGWLAEHMLIVGVQEPSGRTHYVAAAFPSACGKTNLAMLVPPEPMLKAGWKVWTVGDDICWMRPGPDGRLWAINPEAGFFGVAPGTSSRTNPNALAMLHRDVIFTNVAVTADGQPWWEGLDARKPTLDWRGQAFDPACGPAAHPNARFTVSARHCPSLSPQAEGASGVPISAIIFGGRRANLVPLVMEARDWAHGVLMGASMGSETTAAATGTVGVLRRDPMAMKPFCGYHFGDYFAHWLSFDRPGMRLPRIFHVNWFRKSDDGRFLWPGYAENLRVLDWIVRRCDHRAEAHETPVGLLPTTRDLDLRGLDVSPSHLSELLRVDSAGWLRELEQLADDFEAFGDRMPERLDKDRRAMIAMLRGEVAPARRTAS